MRIILLGPLAFGALLALSGCSTPDCSDTEAMLARERSVVERVCGSDFEHVRDALVYDLDPEGSEIENRRHFLMNRRYPPVVFSSGFVKDYASAEEADSAFQAFVSEIGGSREWASIDERGIGTENDFTWRNRVDFVGDGLESGSREGKLFLITRILTSPSDEPGARYVDGFVHRVQYEVSEKSVLWGTLR